MDKFNLQNKQKLAVIFVGAIILISLIAAQSKNNALSQQGMVVVEEPDSSALDSLIDDNGKSNDSEKIVVHVVGCVKVPGVYTLPGGSRINDAVKSAGGLKQNAAAEAINLAAKAEDGAQIYVPSVKDAKALASPANPAESPKPVLANKPVQGVKFVKRIELPPLEEKSSSGKLKSPGDGYVNINSGSLEDLCRLPGVGPATAQRIVDYRSQIGSFSSAQQLMDVKGIGEKKLEKMMPFISL